MCCVLVWERVVSEFRERVRYVRKKSSSYIVVS
jgi:hypothetical protein